MHRSVPDAMSNGGEPLAIVAYAADPELEIGTIERCDDDLGIGHPQNVQDVGASSRGRASREGQLSVDVREPREHTEPAIDRTEFIAPFRDAVRLVDRQERDARPRGRQPSRERWQPLRRAVQECESPAVAASRMTRRWLASSWLFTYAAAMP